MPTEAAPLLSAHPAPMTARGHLVNFVLFSFFFGCFHGPIKASAAYLSTFFPHALAAATNATFYATWTTCTLLITALVTHRLGTKRSLILGSACATAYLLLVLAAVADGPHGALASTLLPIAGVLQGFASGVMWTAQGAYFARAARLYSRARAAEHNPLSLAEAGAWFATVFAAIYLQVEVLSRAGAATFVLAGERVADVDHVFGTYVFLLAILLLSNALSFVIVDVDALAAADEAPASVATGTTSQIITEKPPAPLKVRIDTKSPHAPDAAASEMAGGAGETPPLTIGSAALSSLRLLVTDARVLLLGFFSMAKGFSEALLVDFVNADVIVPSLGAAGVGYVGGCAVLLASLISIGLPAVTRTCGRSWAMQAGNLGFLLLGAAHPIALTFARGSLEDELRLPGAAVLSAVLYSGYALGRAVFDSTNRYVAAALFPAQLEEIFALMRFSEGLAATVALWICPCLDGAPIDWMLIVAAGLAVPGYAAAEYLSRAR